MQSLALKENFRALLKKSLGKRVSQEEVSFILLELALLLDSGLTLLKSLEVLQSQTSDNKIKEALGRIKNGIEKGQSLHRAFSEAGIFPEFFLEMLRVAERGENLQKVVHIAGQYMQNLVQTRTKLMNALAYPAFVIVASLLAVLVVVRMVVPKIASVLEGLGKDLPMITKLLLFFAQILSFTVYLLPILVVFFFLREQIVKREVWDRFILNIPIFGRLSSYYNLSRFAGTLHMALSSGIPVTKAIKLSLGSMSNIYLRKALEGLEDDLAKGKSLSSSLKVRKVLPETFINLVSMGERSGELEKSLLMLRDLYERQAERVISFWLRFAEPLAMLLVGALVAIVVLSVVLPLSEVSTGVRR